MLKPLTKCLKMAKNTDFYLPHLNEFSQMLYFLPNMLVVQEEGAIVYVDKTAADKGGGLGKC